MSEKELTLPKIKLGSRDISKPIMLLIMIIALPFAPELLLFIDFVGIEVAFTCLMIMTKPFLEWLSVLKCHYKNIIITLKKSTQNNYKFLFLVCFFIYIFFYYYLNININIVWLNE